MREAYLLAVKTHDKFSLNKVSHVALVIDAALEKARSSLGRASARDQGEADMLLEVCLAAIRAAVALNDR